MDVRSCENRGAVGRTHGNCLIYAGHIDDVEEVGELADDLEEWNESASFDAIKEAVQSVCKGLFKHADDKSGRVVVIADVDHFVIIHETESDLLKPAEFAKQIAWQAV